MVVYYINKVSEKLSDYRYPIKEGDICMLYDGETVKTIYIDSEQDSDSIWRDFRFIDSKSLKSYQFPTSDSILCAPIGEKHAIGNTGLLTHLIKECKGEWLLDFLNETSAVLSGFVDYWDLNILQRFTGYKEIKVAYENEEAISEFFKRAKEDNVEGNDVTIEDTDVEYLPKNNDIKWFCLSALSCLEGLLDNRTFQILKDTLNGESRSTIAFKHNLTQERIRQIVVKATKQAKELLIEQRNSLEKEKEENAKLNVQLNLMREDITKLKALLPKEILPLQRESDGDLDAELVELLETPIDNITFPVRATNILQYMGIKKFIDIPQIESSMQLLNIRNSGRKTVHDVSCLLKDFHLTFGMSYTEIVEALIANNWHTAKRKWIREDEKKRNIELIDKELSVDNKKHEHNAGHSTDDIEVEHVFVDSRGKVIEKITSSSYDINEMPKNKEDRRGKPWTENEEKLITFYFNQGKDPAIIAEMLGRTEVSIKSRLGCLGLINYTFGQDDESFIEPEILKQETKEIGNFSIFNSSSWCYILDKVGETVFSDEGKLKYINKKLYHFNFKRERFIVIDMEYNGTIWIRGAMKIVAYSETELYQVLNQYNDYIEKIEDIKDNDNFESCKIKVEGVWYFYNGTIFSSRPHETLSYAKRPNNNKNDEIILAPRKKSKVAVGSWIRWIPTGDVGKVVGFKSSGSLTKIVIRRKDGTEMDIYDNPRAYVLLKK